MTNTQPSVVSITGAEVYPPYKSYRIVKILSSSGKIECRQFGEPGQKYGVLWLGGASGGWHSPAKGLYPRMARLLVQKGIVSLQVAYRKATSIQDCMLDALVGLTYLQHMGVQRIALIGYALGGTVAIQVAANASTLKLPIKAVITLAVQAQGGGVVHKLPEDCALLLIHGDADEQLRPECSELLFQQAHIPKELVIYPKARHDLDEVASKIYYLASDWLTKHLIQETAVQ